TLRGIVCDPKLLEGIRELEAEPDLAHAHAPRDRTADVVLLLECNVHSLPAGVEVARVQVRRLGYVQEVVRVSSAEAVALRGRVQPAARVLADRVEHEQPQRLETPPEQALHDQ